MSIISSKTSLTTEVIAKTFKLPVSGTPPTCRSAPGLAVINQYIYLFGGIYDDFRKRRNICYNDLYRLNTRTNVWERLAPRGEQPSPRGYMFMVGDSKRNCVILYGGSTYNADFSKVQMKDDFWLYYPTQNSWVKVVAKNQGPQPRSKGNIWLVNDKVYFFGGASSQLITYNDMWVFNLETNLWTELTSNGDPKSPPPRTESLGGTHTINGSKLIVYGGESRDVRSNNWIVYNDTWAFDIFTNTWTEVTPPEGANVMPPRDIAAAAVINNKLYMQGGALDGVGAIEDLKATGAPFKQRCITDELWCFNPAASSWTKVAPAGDPLPRVKRSSAIAMNGQLYIFCGFDFQWYGNGPGQLWNVDTYRVDFTYQLEVFQSNEDYF